MQSEFHNAGPWKDSQLSTVGPLVGLASDLVFCILPTVDKKYF